MSEEGENESESELEELSILEWRQQRHEENIQILVAIGILGAYITIKASNAIDLPGYLNIPVNLIFGITLVFLVFKLAINSSTPLTDWSWLDPVDRYVPLAYFVSVIGSFLTVVVFFVNANGTGLFSGIETWGPFAIMVIPLVLIPPAAYFGAKNQYQKGTKYRSSLRDELPQTLRQLESSGFVESAKRESILERYRRVFDHDDSLNLWAFQPNGGLVGLLGDGNPGLENSELKFLLTISRRIRRGQKYEDVEEDDFEAIEELLRRAEHRLPPSAL